MAGGGGGTDSGEPEFQIAPMIDVLLVILIFFMTITSASVLKVDKSISLPVAKNAQKKDNSRAETIVNVRWKEGEKKAEFVFDDRAYRTAAELVEPLKTAKLTGEKKVAASAHSSFRAGMRGEHNAPASHVAQAMIAGAVAGIRDISFPGVSKERCA